jgi:hypothetical protein
MRKALLAVIMAAFLLPAKAHGPAKWVQDGNYKNAVGELCCGGTVDRVPGGYQVDAVFTGRNRAGAEFSFPVKGFIADEHATPSPTGDYWACSWGGQVKCFFVVLPGS